MWRRVFKYVDKLISSASYEIEGQLLKHIFFEQDLEVPVVVATEIMVETLVETLVETKIMVEIVVEIAKSTAKKVHAQLAMEEEH